MTFFMMWSTSVWMPIWDHPLGRTKSFGWNVWKINSEPLQNQKILLIWWDVYGCPAPEGNTCNRHLSE